MTNECRNVAQHDTLQGNNQITSIFIDLGTHYKRPIILKCHNWRDTAIQTQFQVYMKSDSTATTPPEFNVLPKHLPTERNEHAIFTFRLDFQLQWHKPPEFHFCFYSSIELLYTPRMIQYQRNYMLMPSQLRLAERMLADHVQAPIPCRNFSCHKYSAEMKMNQQAENWSKK